MAAEGTRYTVMGHGLDTCDEWTKGRQETQKGQEVTLTKEGGDYALQNSWLAGYLTAVNRWFLPGDRGAVRSITDGPDAVLAWMDNYCVTHPSENLDKAAEALAGELSDKWLKAHPPRLTELEKALSPQSAVPGGVAPKDDK